MRGNPVVCSGRFAGDRKIFPAHLPPSSPRPGSPLVAVAALLAACGGESSSDANQAVRHLPRRRHRSELPDRAAPRPDLAAAAGGPQHRQEDRAGADGDDHDRRRRRAGTPRCRSASATRRSGWPSPTGRSGSSPQSYPRLAGSSEPGGATTSNRKTFDFGPLKPGATTERGLEAERGQGRPASRSSTESTPASAAPPRRRPRRRRPRRLLRHRNHRRNCPKPKSPTAAKSSKSRRSASGSEQAGE